MNSERCLPVGRRERFMPNNCCVCGTKMGRMQQYYQLSKNHPEEHLCPDCAGEIQKIYDLANAADPDFRRHVRRFSEKLESGSASGAAIGYLEHFFQNCGRLYRDQLKKVSLGEPEQEKITDAGENTWDSPEPEPDKPAAISQPEQNDISNREEETEADVKPGAEEAGAMPAEDGDGPEEEEPAGLPLPDDSQTGESEDTAMAGTGARIKRIGTHRAGFTSENPDQPEKNGKEQDGQEPENTGAETAAGTGPEPHADRGPLQEEKDTGIALPPETASDRKERSGKSRREALERRTAEDDDLKKMPDAGEEDRFFRDEPNSPGTAFARLMAYLLPIVCGTTGAVLGYSNGSPARTGICAACGIVIGVAGTASILAIVRCLDRVWEMMESVQQLRPKKRQ